jgi:hypothetical protein
MRANELRLGNYVYPYDDINLVSQKVIFRDYINVCIKDFENTNNLFPIPLTEEWLLKFGFNKWKNKNNYSKGSFIIYTLSKKGFHFGKKSLRIKIEHINQLQNLYFALTGEELTIK